MNERMFDVDVDVDEAYSRLHMIDILICHTPRALPERGDSIRPLG
jgi:hypothetical protein